MKRHDSLDIWVRSEELGELLDRHLQTIHTYARENIIPCRHQDGVREFHLRTVRDHLIETIKTPQKHFIFSRPFGRFLDDDFTYSVRPD